MKDDIIILLNNRSQKVELTVQSLGMFLLLSAEDLSITHTFIRKALLNPWVVFSNGQEEIYAIPFSSQKGVFTLYVDVTNEIRKVREVKHFPSLEAAANIGKGYQILYMKQ